MTVEPRDDRLMQSNYFINFDFCRSLWSRSWQNTIKSYKVQSYCDTKSILCRFQLGFIKQQITVNCETLELTDIILEKNSYHNQLRNLYNLKYIKILPYYFQGDGCDKMFLYDMDIFSSNSFKCSINFIERKFKVDYLNFHKI